MITVMEKPTFRSLDREEIHDLLARNHLGRIAYAKGNTIDIEPIHYVYNDGWLYGRTSRGTKIERTGESWWPVAFEVDEADGLFDWQSVVVHGGFYTLSPTGTPWMVDAYTHAVEILQTLVPEAFTDADPTPWRNIVFRIAVQEATGRAASSNQKTGDLPAPFQFQADG